MTVENRIRAITKLQERYEVSLREARLLLEEGFYGSAISHAYYAMFYLALAVLATKDFYRKKHSAVISLFSAEFVKPGIVSKDLSSKLRKAFEDRLVADYDFEITKTEPEARHALKEAEEFANEIVSYLDNWIAENQAESA